MSVQIAVRLPDSVLESLDSLVGNGRYGNRAAAVRSAIERFIDDERQAAIGAAIADGYRRRPPSEAEDAWAAASTREMIAEEPW